LYTRNRGYINKIVTFGRYKHSSNAAAHHATHDGDAPRGGACYTDINFLGWAVAQKVRIHLSRPERRKASSACSSFRGPERQKRRMEWSE